MGGRERLRSGFAAALLLVAAVPVLREPASIALIERYARVGGPYHDVAVSDADADAYWAGAGKRRLPAGVSQVRMRLEPGAIVARARVDFQRLAPGAGRDPLLALFSGTHRITVRAQLDSGRAPRAKLTVTEVRLDGSEIPTVLVDTAIAVLIQPRHPGFSRMFSVALPRHALSVAARAGNVLFRYPRG